MEMQQPQSILVKNRSIEYDLETILVEVEFFV